MANIPHLIDANQRRWAAMHFQSSRLPEFEAVSKRLIAPSAKVRYQEISKVTKVPWFVIAVIHELEASQNFNSQLGQGDPLGQVSVHVPKGRGPFFNHLNDPPLQDAFYRGALDALIDCPPHAASWHDWSAGGALTLLEQYNGLGYADMGRPSPYNWAGTSEYTSGKYVSDGVYDPNAVSQQLGCAGLLRYMSGLDSSITFGPVPALPPPPIPSPIPVPIPIPTPTPVRPPVATIPAVQVDLSGIWKLVQPFIPTILDGAAMVFPPAAPFILVAKGAANIIAQVQTSDGTIGTAEKIIAKELYAVALALNPALKGT